MTYDEALTLIRVPIYLFTAVEFFAVYYLYNYGTYKYRPSNIIRSLVNMFLVLGIFFSAMSFIPVLKYVGHDSYSVSLRLIPIIVAPVGFWVRRFRQDSTKEQN